LTGFRSGGEIGLVDEY